MEKLSHWADVLKWLERVVDSCKTRSHVRNCEYLILNFHRLYKERLGESNCYELTRKMRHKLIDIESDWIHNKLKK